MIQIWFSAKHTTSLVSTTSQLTEVENVEVEEPEMVIDEKEDLDVDIDTGDELVEDNLLGEEENIAGDNVTAEQLKAGVKKAIKINYF